MSNRFSIAKARDCLASLVHEAEKGVPIELTRRGKPVAILVSLLEYQRLVTGKAGFWEALTQFWDSKNFKEAQLEPDDFVGLRDRTSGREPGW